MRGSVAKSGGSWMYVVDLPRGVEGRRRQRRKRGFRTRKDAEAALHEMLAQLGGGEYVQPAALTTAEFLVDQWLPAVELRVEWGTYTSYEGHVRLHIVPAVGGIRLQELTPAMLSAAYRDMLSSGLSAKTVKNIHGTLHKALQDAVRWQVLARNVAGLADLPRVTKKEMRTWTVDQTRTFLDLISDHRFEVPIRVAGATGMRRGEVLGLRWPDMDLDAGRVSVRHAIKIKTGRIVLGPTKHKRGRSVPLDKGTVEALRRHRARQAEWQLAMGSGWANEWDLVFTQSDGRPYRPDSLSADFAKLVKESGLPRIRLHDLRHTFATVALSHGVPIKVISEVVGHSSTAFTLDQYAHVTPSMLEEVARIVGDSFGD